MYADMTYSLSSSHLDYQSVKKAPPSTLPVVLGRWWLAYSIIFAGAKVGFLKLHHGHV